jgi:hypothetical protein
MSAIGGYVLVGILYISTECSAAKICHQKPTYAIIKELKAHARKISLVNFDVSITVIK